MENQRLVYFIDTCPSPAAVWQLQIVYYFSPFLMKKSAKDFRHRVRSQVESLESEFKSYVNRHSNQYLPAITAIYSIFHFPQIPQIIVTLRLDNKSGLG
jgi:hypothetical protein